MAKGTVVPITGTYGKGNVVGLPKVPAGKLGGPGNAIGLPQVPEGKGAPPAPAPPAAPQAPAAPAASSGSSPLDSTYYANIAANNLKVGNQINALTAQSGNLATNLQAALGQLAYQQPRDQLKLEQNANRAGGLYSSVYDQNLGNLNNTYLTKQSGLTSTEGQKVAANAAQIAGLQQGIPIFNSGQYDAAVARATRLAAANPATGQQPIPAPAAPALPPAAQALAGAIAKRSTVPLPKVPEGKGKPPKSSSFPTLGAAIPLAKSKRRK